MRICDERRSLASAIALVLLGVSIRSLAAPQQSARESSAHTQIVLLGTGTPAADPDRFGPATAIIVNDTAYLVDAGAGIVRRAAAAARDRSLKSLQAANLRIVFLTHLHSDHTVGLPDLMLSPWTLGRRVPLEMYGPGGTSAMAQHLLEAYRVDIETRTNADGNQRDFPKGANVNAHDSRAGMIYKDPNITVTAFATTHASESYGYRFDTPDRSIVISGDTGPAQATIDACNGCDVMIHEVNSLAWLEKRPPAFQAFAAKYHTTTAQLADLATRAKPRLLILYHVQAFSPDEVFKEMVERYNGHVVVGRDLDVY
jgi:ribonuclease BN (tRNA processing enzyme)